MVEREYECQNVISFPNAADLSCPRKTGGVTVGTGFAVGMSVGGRQDTPLQGVASCATWVGTGWQALSKNTLIKHRIMV